MAIQVSIDTMTKEQLLAEIVCNDGGLYEAYNEDRLLNDNYTENELKEIAINWIIKNNEAGWGGYTMTPSELKYESRNTAPYFFSRSTMKFFGDTMRNYGVRSNTIDGIDVWEVYRKKPVMHGLQNSHYFRKDNFETISKGN